MWQKNSNDDAECQAEPLPLSQRDTPRSVDIFPVRDDLFPLQITGRVSDYEQAYMEGSHYVKLTGKATAREVSRFHSRWYRNPPIGL